jgi:hypothetical protein
MLTVSLVTLGPENQDEVIYCTDVQADSCGYLENEDQCDSSVVTYGESDRDGDSDDEQTGKLFSNLNSFFSNYLEWPTLASSSVRQMTTNRFDEIDLDDDGIEDNQKEMQSLL